MTVKELVSITPDVIVLYTQDDFNTDLFRGHRNEFPDKYLDLEVKYFGAKKRNILDVCVVL